ncbi:hypothetical protein SELMODRAFT_428659 [Selaginella moellendorffii]|uniref:Uncharacterized protein FAMA1-1 n=2 Tax=Selaginella moellendorffii TaxID=88036 RepID=D8T3L6_SELML|nr:hypothetical protein SELMODRAFT_428659 [Selaginella moellendorffii]
MMMMVIMILGGSFTRTLREGKKKELVVSLPCCEAPLYYYNNAMHTSLQEAFKVAIELSFKEQELISGDFFVLGLSPEKPPDFCSLRDCFNVGGAQALNAGGVQQQIPRKEFFHLHAQGTHSAEMEEAATTCVMPRFMASTSSSVEYQNHSLLFSPYHASAADSSAMDSTDVSLMGNLLTDLSSDFPYIGATTASGRYSVPDILQFPADQASKVTLLQMLEESDTSSPNSYTHHLKLPVLEEPCDKLHKQQQPQLLSCSSETGLIHQPDQSVGPEKCIAGLDSVDFSSAAESLLKPCKVEPEFQAPPVVLAEHNSVIAVDTFNSAAISANSDDISNHLGAAAGTAATAGVAAAVAGTTNSAGGCAGGGVSQSSSGAETPGTQHRPKRKRIKSCKNSEEVESQRQTHIAVERNRRKQMNEHLNVLRSLMPGSYVQRGDQASIIGGAIEFVKELEQLLQCLQAQKRRRLYSDAFSPKPSPSAVSSIPLPPFPPYASSPAPSLDNPDPTAADSSSKFVNDNFYDCKQIVAEAKSEVADIEVRMAGSDAVVKILSQRRPGQLLKTISALESMCMSIVHTNITTIEQTVLYSFTVRIGMESRLSVDEIAQGIQRIFSCNVSAAASDL